MPCSVGALILDIATLTLDVKRAILAGDNLAKVESHLYYSLEAEVGPLCSVDRLEGLARDLLNLVQPKKEGQMGIKSQSFSAHTEQHLYPSF